MKLVFFICLVMVLPWQGNTQSVLKVEISYEAAHLTSLMGTSSYSPATTVYGSLAYELNVLPWMSVSAQLSMHERGHDRDNLMKEKIRIAYYNVQLPLIFYPFSVKKEVNPFLTLGPYLGIKREAMLYNVQFSFSDRPEDLSDLFDKQVRQLDLGLVAGTGLAYRIGKVNIYVAARYHLGMKRIGKEDPGPEVSDFVGFVLRQNGAVRALSGSFGLGYQLN